MSSRSHEDDDRPSLNQEFWTGTAKAIRERLNAKIKLLPRMSGHQALSFVQAVEAALILQFRAETWDKDLEIDLARTPWSNND